MVYAMEHTVRVVAVSAVLLIALGGAVSAMSWRTETVDSNGSIGYYTSLALDGADNPHISYPGGDDDLMYTWHDGAGWHTETVASAGYVGEYSSLALDATGNPRITYYEYEERELKYAWRDSTGWHDESVDPSSIVGGSMSLALDVGGNPRISYASGGLKYAWREGTVWHNETVDSNGDVGLFASLALDGAGNPRISYFDYSNAALKYAWRDGAGWHTETVDEVGDTGFSTSLALDSAGNPRISYLDHSNDDLKFAWHDGSEWHLETVDSIGYMGGFSTSLELDSADHPRISYYHAVTYDGDTIDGDLRYAWRDGWGWHTEEVDSLTGMCYSSLALDSAGNPRISYGDFPVWNDAIRAIRYAWGTPTAPVLITVPGGVYLPRDRGGDGLYEDVNGNGVLDFNDLVLYFQQMEWIAAYEPLALFDYNQNGTIDFADIIWLFVHIDDVPTGQTYTVMAAAIGPGEIVPVGNYTVWEGENVTFSLIDRGVLPTPYATQSGYFVHNKIIVDPSVVPTPYPTIESWDSGSFTPSYTLYDIRGNHTIYSVFYYVEFIC